MHALEILVAENILSVDSNLVKSFNPYWQIMENSSGNFSQIFIFRVVTQAVLLENSSIRFFTETIYDM